jgi:PTS system mannose-specific IIB component
MTSWTKQLQIKRIVIVDDQVAADDFMKVVLSMSAPAGVEIEILTVADAVDRVQQNVPGNTMLLFKRISAALELQKKLAGTPSALSELNLGNLGSVPGRDRIAKNVFLSGKEKAEVQELEGMGVDVYLQMLYTEPRVDASKLIG